MAADAERFRSRKITAFLFCPVLEFVIGSRELETAINAISMARWGILIPDTGCVSENAGSQVPAAGNDSRTAGL
jgi:hypothetical protein